MSLATKYVSGRTFEDHWDISDTSIICLLQENPHLFLRRYEQQTENKLDIFDAWVCGNPSWIIGGK